MTRVIAFILLLPTPAFAQYPTAKAIADACANPADLNQAVCDSYIRGVTDTAILTGVLGCEPNDYDPAEIRKAAIAEMGKTPDRTAAAAITSGSVLRSFPAKNDSDSGAVCTGFGGGTGQINLWTNMPNVNPG